MEDAIKGTGLQGGGGLLLIVEIYSLSALHNIRGHPGIFLSEQRSERYYGTHQELKKEGVHS